MSEPSSGVPSEIADSEVQPAEPQGAESVELDLDEDKLEAWDEVKGDYQVDPGGEPVPNSQEDRTATGADRDDAKDDHVEDDEQDEGAPGPS